MQQKKIVIIGSGPTGLGAAYRLKELGHENFTIYEKSPYIGGLASSFRDPAGFTWDIGGHVMFSHYKYYDDCFDKLMGKDFQLNMRECWVRMFNSWIPYPFQNNIRYLPKEAAYECLSGLIKAQTSGRSAKDCANFQEFIETVFGEGIVKYFMGPYNYKVWAHPPKMMNKEWIGERVAMIDIDRALKNVMLSSDDFGWGPNNMFKYPLYGGTGEFYRRFGPAIGTDKIVCNATIEHIDIHNKTIRFRSGDEVSYDILISAMPLDILVNRVLTGTIPDEIRESAADLRHSGDYMVGVGIKQKCPSTKSWMYFPESNCPFYRVTYLSNYSPHMTPDNETHYSLLTETSYSEFKSANKGTIVQETIRGLINAGLISEKDQEDICDTWLFDAPYGYPTPSVERDGILQQVIPWLEEKDIYSRGRFGMWKYEVSNTDHTLMQGVELANRLILGEAETTIGIKYESTADGREAAKHERAAVAGSGCPKPFAPGRISGRRTGLASSRVKTVIGMNSNGSNGSNGKNEPEPSEEELGVTDRMGDRN